MTQLRVGFIGLGDQGAPIARRILEAGFRVALWARRAETLTPFAGSGAIVKASPAALAADCDLLGICVVNEEDVKQVLLEQGALAAMRPGGLIALHSTLLPGAVVELEALARARGVDLLDAPVSGGAKGAKAGTMTVMVGGAAEALERARPVLATFATHITHLGPPGAGQLIKLLNNNLAYANLSLGIEALELARALGMDAVAAARIIRTSSGMSTGFGILTDKTLFGKITGPTSNLAKDVHHLAAVAAERGLQDAGLLQVAAGTRQRLRTFAQETGGVFVDQDGPDAEGDPQRDGV